MKRFPCIAHTLQLVVKAITRSQSYNNLITKAKDLMKTVRISSVGQEQLLQLAGKVVVKDCTTRWNATLLMIDRLLDVRSDLEVVLKSLKRDSLTNTEWARLSDIQRLLGPFRDQTNILQTDTMSLSYVIHSLLELSLHLQDTSLPKMFAQQLREDLLTHFAIFLNPSSTDFDPLPAAACLLDPTVSSVLSDREDASDLLAAAKAFIKVKVPSVIVCVCVTVALLL